MDINKINKVYLAGIGGMGLSALAYYFLKFNKKVIGSDLIESKITKKLEEQSVKINFNQKSINITEDIDLFIYTSALPKDHPELLQAKKLKIKILNYFEFLGFLSKKYKTIAIAGTNGKTTTTTILGLILEKAGLDPTVIVGTLVPEWGSNFRFGKSDILVLETCEWQAHMLEIDPVIIILTNIAEDHLDYYKDLADIKEHFQKFINKLPNKGLLVKNKDDLNSNDINYHGQILTFGKKGDYTFSNLEVQEGKQVFNINNHKVTLNIPGEYNVYNSLAAFSLAQELGVSEEIIINSLKKFKGTWRRFEILGNYNNNIVISDYAHHPEAIRGLLQATKDFYPEQEIIAIFQPHHHHRTKTLLNDFAASFSLADQVIISEIYRVGGREEKEEKISSIDLVNIMNHKYVKYAKDFKVVKDIIKEINPINSVLLFIGAGDIDNLAREIIKK